MDTNAQILWGLPYLIKKSVIVFLFTFLILSCKAYKVVYSQKSLSVNQSAINSKVFSENKNIITFIREFNKGAVIIYADNELIFNDTITTDVNTGAAQGIQFNKQIRKLKLLINEEKISLKNMEDYRFIYVRHRNNRFEVEYTREPYLFY